jgi:hypothetical protein
MQRIDDQRFLRAFCRMASWPSRHLDGCVLFVEATSGAITITISNTVVAILQFVWTRQHGARLLPGSRLLAPDDLWGLNQALTYHVERFLRRHHFIDRPATRRHTA